MKQKKKCYSFPHVLEFEDQSSSCDMDMCNIFAKFFASVYELSQPSSNNYCDNPIDTTVIFTPILSVSEVHKGALELKESFSCGPDNVPSYIIKHRPFLHLSVIYLIYR